MSALSKIAEQFRTTAITAGVGHIGVHFSTTSLNLVQLERDRAGKLSMRAHASEPLLGERGQIIQSKQAVRTLVRRALKAGPFRGRRVISTMPLDQVRLMSIAYPAGPTETEPATIAAQMAERVDGDLADYVIDYVPVRTSIRDGERLCMVAVARREHVLAYLDALSHAALTVEALEVGPLAIRRLVESMSSPSNVENVLAINTGDEATYLTLISGRRLLANQEVAFGESALISKVATTLDIQGDVAGELLRRSGLRATPDGDPDDSDIRDTLLEIVRPEFVKLVKEIERAFLYAASESYGQANRRIYLVGNLTRLDGAPELLESLAGIPVQPMDKGLLPFAIPDRQKLAGGRAAELAVASGLALWRMTGDD